MNTDTSGSETASTDTPRESEAVTLSRAASVWSACVASSVVSKRMVATTCTEAGVMVSWIRSTLTLRSTARREEYSSPSNVSTVPATVVIHVML